MDGLEILTEARRLIEREENWTRGWFAKDRDGNRVCSQDETAFSFCSGGAFARSCRLNFVVAIEKHKLQFSLLTNAAVEMGHASPSDLNDETDHATVLKMFDRAIELSRGDAAIQRGGE